MANLRTRKGIIKALWEKVQIKDKEHITSISFFLSGGVQLAFNINEKGELDFHPENEDLEKINTMSFLKTLYDNFYGIHNAVVSRGKGFYGGYYIADYVDDVLALK